MQTENPKFKIKLLFWLTLGVLSTFFAEVISGSTPFPFIPIMSLWGLLVVLPLYTLHTLVFAYFVYRFGKPVFHTLFFAGALFGMYEAYATGVLWAGWSTPPPIAVFELGIIETLVLVLFWHPILAFMLPVIFAETSLTQSNESLPSVVRFTTRKAMIILAVILAFVQSLNMVSPAMALMVSLTSIPAVGLFIFVWLKLGLNRYSMRELLPNKTEFRIIFVLMLLQYVFLGAVSIGKYPGVSGHISVLALYLILILIFVKSLQASRQTVDQHIEQPSFSWRGFVLLSIIFTLAATMFSFGVMFLKPGIWVPVLLIYSLSGIVLFGIAIRQVFKKT